MDCGTLAPKAQKRQPPMAGSWRNITHIGTIVDGGTERLCLLRGGLAYGSRQAFFDALTSYRLLKSFFCILEKIVFDCKDVSFQSSTL